MCEMRCYFRSGNRTLFNLSLNDYFWPMYTSISYSVAVRLFFQWAKTGTEIRIFLLDVFPIHVYYHACFQGMCIIIHVSVIKHGLCF